MANRNMFQKSNCSYEIQQYRGQQYQISLTRIHILSLESGPAPFRPTKITQTDTLYSVQEFSTFWCPTDSCRNRSIPVDSTGVRQESTGMEVNPEEWKAIHRNSRSIHRNGSQSRGTEGQSRGMEVSPQE